MIAAAALLGGARYAALLGTHATPAPQARRSPRRSRLLARRSQPDRPRRRATSGERGESSGRMGAIASVTAFPRAVGFFSGEPRMEPESFRRSAMLAGAPIASADRARSPGPWKRRGASRRS